MLTQTRIIALTAALVLGGTALAQAQITVGPRIGLNLADISSKYKDSSIKDDVDHKLLLAPQAGITINAAFGNLAVQPSVLFSQKGIKTESEKTAAGITSKNEGTSRLNYLEIPINLVYTTDETEGFQVFAGPYVGIGFGGKSKGKNTTSGGGISKTTSSSTDIKFASQQKANSSEAYYNQPDFGVNGGVGYKVGPLQAQVGYSFGLNTLVPKDVKGNRSDAFKQHNRVIQFSLTYFFGS